MHRSNTVDSLDSGCVLITPSGIRIERLTKEIDFTTGIDFLIDQLDNERGLYLSSGVEDPDRYARWDIGFCLPPLELVSTGRDLFVRALNPRGEKLLNMLRLVLLLEHHSEIIEDSPRLLHQRIRESTDLFSEEDRSLQPTIFSPLRCLIEEFNGIQDSFLGLYGAFGYDLLFQFEKIIPKHKRDIGAKDLHLFLPDQIYTVDRRKERAYCFDYIFSHGESTTDRAERTHFVPAIARPPKGKDTSLQQITSDHSADEYAALVDAARERMHVGDIFEIVLHRQFSVPFVSQPSALFRAMHRINPSPYEFLYQLGEEQLVGTSPEMFIRVDGDRVESCPISGTVRRGKNAMEDAELIRTLYNSEKDEVELTMCTDVDRNDKSRICRPGTVKLLGRRLIERYAGLFHTVDHVEGRLRPGLTGIDAFMSHMWAVTLTGAPKKMAVQLIEEMEKSPRGWYGGAIGALLFNGNINTGITIRTVHLKDGQANYRVGATLVYDSVGEEEEKETLTKATPFFKIIDMLDNPAKAIAGETTMIGAPENPLGQGLRILVIDYEDSFVHTLASYLRETGAEVVTYRSNVPLDTIINLEPDLVIHSPGPGTPAQFGVPERIKVLAEQGVPQFGVCLGLQGMAEAFGGELGVLDVPRHGKIWNITHDGTGLFEGIPNPCRVGAYHSLHALRERLPDCLEITAENESGLVMAIRHRELPIEGVQFHPESILSMQEEVGRALIRNLVRNIVRKKEEATKHMPFLAQTASV